MSASRATNGATERMTGIFVSHEPGVLFVVGPQRLVLEPQDLNVAREADDLFGDLPLESPEDATAR